MIEVTGRNGTAKVMTDGRDEKAIAHLHRLMGAGLTKGSVVRVMADYHEGKGAVIGYTQRLNPDDPRVCPNVVGVDIGCRVSALRLPGVTDMDLPGLDAFIRANIPLGVGGYATSSRLKDRLLKRTPPERLEIIQAAEAMLKEDLVDGYTMKTSVVGQLLSLGGGNHYIEVDRGGDGCLWLGVHSGSRNFGLTVANTYQRKAEESSVGGPTDLSYLDKGSPYLARYMLCADACAMFSLVNHEMILRAIRGFIAGEEDFAREDLVTTLHNYVDTKRMIIRKGAVSAMAGGKFLMPLNMRDGVAVCVGKGNWDYNLSAPHGCGRLMSRAQAKRELDPDKVSRDMADAGVFTTSLGYSLDEAADAYKAPGTILAAIRDTAEVVEVMRPVYNIKGR